MIRSLLQKICPVVDECREKVAEDRCCNRQRSHLTCSRLCVGEQNSLTCLFRWDHYDLELQSHVTTTLLRIIFLHLLLALFEQRQRMPLDCLAGQTKTKGGNGKAQVDASKYGALGGLLPLNFFLFE